MAVHIAAAFLNSNFVLRIGFGFRYSNLSVMHALDGDAGYNYSRIMAKARGVEARLDRLRRLRTEVLGPEQRAELRQALLDKSNLVAAEAAEIAGARMATDLAPDLVAAFGRFMSDPEETDKRCAAKIAIVEALNKLEYDRADVYLTGIRHVQMEPRWGGSDDTAAPLRVNAAFGLVRINYPDVVLMLADLLADSENTARAGAAQALGASGSRAAIPLLRFKAKLGDDDPAVIAECLTALMTAAPEESLPFVAGFLDDASEAIQEGAAFALAESRRADALEILKKHWPEARHSSLREALLLAISMTRLPAALDFLLEIISEGDQAAALAAVSALAIHRHNEAVKERIVSAIGKKKDPALLDRFKKKFESNST